MKEFKGELITSQRFEGVLLDIYRGEDDFLFTADQITEAVGFKDESSLKQVMIRNPELRNREFSILCKVDSMEGGVKKQREKRLFTEEGLYEILLLANTDRAKALRKFVRGVLKKIRRGEIVQGNPVIANNKSEELLLQIKDLTEEVRDGDDEILEKLEDVAKKYDVLMERMDVLEKRVQEAQKDFVKAYAACREIINGGFNGREE
ncbi:BRO-N domain-containing protein [Fusobacterium necrophorum]|uniref:Bro-N domain-containing protein n=2 Tax=Fusobacterium necrophorum TaxID=859 RepID=A0AAN3VXH2_9FUSO|nr:hypothetical protein [Fusobacterium necrophorum]AYV94676.1 hypothetical protein BWX37_03170 [Fusobacterium necrophorum subsp. funduliforme]EJU18774.1 hypothetical protein HMPREF1127_1102 [Fusobacterium necrophorum subsp. funduliforme Fnf 1007]KYL03314.1 hypothetical protein A2J06_09260 [Fusobacterium necrophorum subsp. funduliforme]KYM40892.1 hypothetical protein A2U03_03685 [Fusobacterium necrophorum subsp. funduliforme]KYM44070.1 hypothetical protein A2U15_07165 [Fusobacterium necrophorum